jgi:2-polyprenyl-6-methoxyphenol hydroxylase-like FAD-dependent oxidoreductase
MRYCNKKKNKAMKIIISGGGIAGLTVANMLQRRGHQAIIIDKAREFSNAGFVLSLKSFGVEIMNELDLEDKLRGIATRSNFANFYKQDGELVRELSYGVINKHLADSILATRGGIHLVLLEAIRNNVELRLGTIIKSVMSNEEAVTVALSDGSLLDADLLIVAEGLRSPTRNMIWKDSPVEDFNTIYAAGRLPGKHAYSVGCFQTYRGVRKMLAILPLSENELALQCYIHRAAGADHMQAIEEGILSDTFEDFNQEVKSLIKKLEKQGGIFSDKMGMVHVSDLHKDRVILLGDAGYCPTSFSGMGASLAIFGAKALVHFLDESPEDMNRALETYNEFMQPVILKFQHNARKNAKTFVPKNKTSLQRNNFILKYVPDYFISKKMSGELTLSDGERNFQLGNKS